MSMATILPIALEVYHSIGWFFVAYGLGSIPEAWLLSRWITGQDLRQMGSGNVGVMNTALSVTRWAGLLVFLAEIAKGFLAVLLPRLFGAGETIVCLSIMGVVIGTRWPVWLGFKGGRGNTAGMAALLLIAYPAPVIALALWILLRLFLQDSFKATRLTILSFPLLLGMVTRSVWFALTGLALSLIYLSAQQAGNDDHLIIKERWKSFWVFLSSPKHRIQAQSSRDVNVEMIRKE